MKLWEIDAELERILSREVDLETGEITDDTLAKLDALEMERNAKALAVARYAMGERAEGEAVKAQADRLAKRASGHARRAERLVEYIAAYLPAGTKLHDDVVQLSWRKSESCVVVDEAKVPETFWRVKREVNKADAKATMKLGEKVPGCELLVKQNLSVK